MIFHYARVSTNDQNLSRQIQEVKCDRLYCDKQSGKNVNREQLQAMMANIREEKGYTYGIYSTIASFPFNGCLLIATETGNEYVEPCIREIRHELKRLQDELVPVHELDMVKNYMIGEICRSYESPFSLSDAWIFTETAGLDSDFYIRMVETIQQVSREELQRLAVEYFRPDNMLEVVAGKKM